MVRNELPPPTSINQKLFDDKVTCREITTDENSKWNVLNTLNICQNKTLTLDELILVTFLALPRELLTSLIILKSSSNFDRKFYDNKIS